MSDIVAFLLARIGEDEAIAAQLDWCPYVGTWEHVEPDRMLAECKAKETLIANLMQSNVPASVRMWCLGTMALPYADHPDYEAVMRDNGPGTAAWSGA